MTNYLHLLLYLIMFILSTVCNINFRTNKIMYKIDLAAETWLTNCTTNEHAYSSDYRCRAIFYARTTSAALSVLGCCLVLFIIIVYKKYHHFTQRLIMYLLLPTFVISGVSVYPNISNTNRSCEIAGFFMNWGILSQRLIILCIVIHLLVFTFRQRRPAYLELMFHIVTWGFSLCFSIVPLFGHHYGSAGVWCWIKGETLYEEGLRFGCFYVWVWCCILVEIVCFGLVVVRVQKQLRMLQGNPDAHQLKEQYKKYIYPLLLYPLVNFVLAIPVTANRIQNWIERGNPLFVLFLLHSIVYPIWGFFNAMMYFMNRETILQLHPCNVLEQLISCQRSSSQSPQVSNNQHQPGVNVDFNYAANVLVNPSALHSATVESGSDME